MMKFLKLIFLLNLVLLANLGHALESPGIGASLVIDQSETLYVNDGDVFDLSSFDLQAGGILDIYSNTPNATFSIMVSNAIRLSGLLNVYLSNISFVSDSFYLSGTLLTRGGNVSLSAQHISLTGTIDLTGSNETNDPNSGSIDAVVTIPGFPNDPKIPLLVVNGNTGITVTPGTITSNVPESKSFALLLAGLCFIGVVTRNRGFNLKNN
jgi:hypothetical protein